MLFPCMHVFKRFIDLSVTGLSINSAAAQA